MFGDHGKLYVPAELVQIYRKEVIPLANVVTPNQFEAEKLTGMKIKTFEDASKALFNLHELGPKLVVLTSMVLEGCSDKMFIVASQRHHDDEGNEDEEGKTTTRQTKQVVWRIESPILPGTYTGTGDLTAALFLAWTAKDPGNLGNTLEKVVSTMFTVIQTTQKESDGTIQGKELKLIKSKNVIENPPKLFKAEQINI